MAIKYYKLLDLMNRRSIQKTSLKRVLGFGPNTIAKLSSHRPVSIEVINKLCNYLKVQPGDIMEWVEEED